MSILDVVKCPICDHEHDMSEYDFDSDEMDIECENEECKKEFEVIREWYPSYSSKSIEYANCNNCGKEARTDHLYISGEKELCQPCFYKREIEKITGN